MATSSCNTTTMVSIWTLHTHTHTSYTFSHWQGYECVAECVSANTHTDRTCYLDERQRLLSAADQCGFLLLLLLHDGGKGHQGGGGRAAHRSQHPGPEGKETGDTERKGQREDGYRCLCSDSESNESGGAWRLSQTLVTSSCV